MPAHLIDGKAIAEARRVRLAAEVAALIARGIQPCLAAVSVHADAGWSVYLKNQAAACAQVGIRHQVSERQRLFRGPMAEMRLSHEHAGEKAPSAKETPKSCAEL